MAFVRLRVCPFCASFRSFLQQCNAASPARYPTNWGSIVLWGSHVISLVTVINNYSYSTIRSHTITTHDWGRKMPAEAKE